LKVLISGDLVADQLEKGDLLGLGTHTNCLHEAVLELGVLAAEGDHGHMALA